ncbi:hypothetical protein ACFL7D_01435 [candidate division KSB1 bacterium]
MRDRFHMFIYALIFMVVLFAGCSDQSEEKFVFNKDNISKLPVDEKRPLKYVSYENQDKIRLFNPGILKYNPYNNLIYICDTGNHRIVIVDTELNYVGEFGRFGQGPQEFNEPNGLLFTENRIFVSDIQNRRMQVFDYDYKNQSSFYWNNISYVDFMCINSEGKIIHNNPKDHVFEVLDLNGNKISDFGELVATKNNRFKTPENELRYDIDPDDNVFCTFKNHPMIRQYDRNFNLIYESDVSYIPGVITRTEFNKKQTLENPGRYYTKWLNESLTVDDNYIYIRFKENGYPIYVFEKNTSLPVEKIILKPKIDELIDYDFKYITFSPNYLYTIDTINFELYMYKK